MSKDGDRRRVRELRDAAARKYLPERVDLLLVAEAPPAADDRYFYFEHVHSHDWLFLGVAEVLLGDKPGRATKASTLAELKNRGTFLIDLKLDPADSSDLAMHVPDLVARCAALRPRRIVLIKAPISTPRTDLSWPRDFPSLTSGCTFHRRVARASSRGSSRKH